jgi:hypothetical protein
MGDKSIKYYKYLNITSENAKERLLNEDQVQDPLMAELDVLERALASIG